MTVLNKLRGFSLVPALFLLVVLAALGAVAVRLSAVEHQTFVLALQSSRAYAAAQAGIEWSSYQALVNGSCGNSSVALTEGGLSGFTVDTTCSSTAHSEGATTTNVFVLDAFAYSGVYGTPDYVSRRVRATVTDAS
ncbi:MAG: pilus assembly protein MshP [Gammaproteobacteria bacterium]|nr:pilus assembly protein MshP [Gammaproteobacteria bacterium]MDH3362751.1 pilus assembly protein MshP [Gammaproteobacteria bacterium]MDH3481568.1 pilus assembly protein MshP [Gammaproteobacteria bacterium]